MVAKSALDRQQSECPSAAVCPNYTEALSDHHTVNVDGTASTIAFSAGAALVVGGITLWIVENRTHAASAAPVTAGVSSDAGAGRPPFTF